MRPASIRLAAILLLITVSSGAPAAEIASELEAIEPPRVVVKGRVLQRDGVTGVGRADLTMTSSLGIEETVRSGRGGRFKMRLPAGEYRLVIRRASQIYESPSVYRVVPGGTLSIDFLLLKDFEGHNPGPERRPAGSGPAPRREPEVVGSVVDVVQDTRGKRRHRWREALAFIGSILAVAAAAD